LICNSYGVFIKTCVRWIEKEN